MPHTSVLSDSLKPLSGRGPQVVREREILRIAAGVGAEDGEKAAQIAREQILKWAETRTGNSLPENAWAHEDFEHFAGGRDCSAVRISDQSKDIWALRVDVPDKTVAQRVWTTEAIIGRMVGSRALFGLRLLVSSPEEDLRIVPVVPHLVNQLESHCGLFHGMKKLDPTPWIIQSEDEAEQLIDLLIDPARKIPAFVLTTMEFAGGTQAPLLDASELARKLLALAHVVILPARFTWTLTERFGKQLSVFGGAARVYLAGFSEDSEPYTGHELILADRLSGVENSLRASARLHQIAARESLRQFKLAKDVLSFAAVREQSLESRRIRLQEEGATDTEQLQAAQVQIEALKKDFLNAQEEQQWLSDEHKFAEDRAQTAEAQLTAAAFRIQQLVVQIKARGESPDTNISLPTSWAEFGDWCEQNLIGRVLLSSRARREVKAPQFRDVRLAAGCLLWLANDYRERRLNGGDGDLRIAIENGIQNDRCGADSFQIEWQGSHRDVEWHIKNGGNTRDPTRCLRIYYFWDDSSQQVIIASMPAHVETDAT